MAHDEVALILGISFFITSIALFGLFLMTRANQAPAFGKWFKDFLIGDFGFILILLAVLLLNFIPAILLDNVSAHAGLKTIMTTLYQISLVVTILTTVICSFFYIFLRSMMISLAELNLQKSTFSRGKK